MFPHRYALVLLILTRTSTQVKVNATALHRMIGGTLAFAEENPFCVFIMSPEVVCSGAIVTKNLVLTAGHCMRTHQEPSDYEVKTVARGRGTRGVKLILHVDFPTTKLDGPYECNIGFIMVDQPFRFDALVKKVGLSISAPPYATSNCFVVSYGTMKSNGKYGVLHKTSVNDISRGPCLKSCCDAVSRATPFKRMGSGDAGAPVVCGGVLVGVVNSLQRGVHKFALASSHFKFLKAHAPNADFFKQEKSGVWTYL